MEIYKLYKSFISETLLAEIIVFDDGQTIVKWQGKVASLTIHKNLDAFKEISVLPQKRSLEQVL